MSEETDMAALMELPAFQRFLWRSIQTAGLLEYSGIAANGSDGRDLAFREGRRSLGFDLLRMAEAGLPVALRDPDHVMTWLSILREAAQSQTSEKPRGRRSRTDELDGDDDGAGDAG